jgi:hypothetical protein
MDRSFWSLHDDPTTYAILGLPTFVVFSTLGLSLVYTVRTFEPDPGLQFLIWGIIVPWFAFVVTTFCPLPCSIYVWSQAHEENKPAGECFSELLGRLGRLIPVAAWLLVSFTWWALLFWLPSLILWPRTCMAPVVALFEDQRHVFRRTRGLMHEDHAIYVLAGLYLLLTLVLGTMIFVPRTIFFVDIIKTPWLATLEDSIWAFELIAGTILLTGVAMSWCVSLTLFYHDLRYHREGESLRNKIDSLYDKHGVSHEPV